LVISIGDRSSVLLVFALIGAEAASDRLIFASAGTRALMSRSDGRLSDLLAEKQA
jgi:hypothetical protein